jgi:hydrogenase maturation protein HypF
VRVSAPPVRGSGPDAAEGAGAAAEAPAGILAMGGDMKSSFCLGLETGEAVLSQHIGELANPRALDFLSLSLARFTELFRTEPELVVGDLHPEYLSRAFARDYAGRHGLPLLSVQHHHAHVASCMAEHGLREQVIGISMDGTGYGEDGAVWGGEVLVCDLAGYRRLTHLAYVPMPGGEAAIREPWRMAVSYLYAAYGEREAARGLLERLGIVPEPETGARVQKLHALFDAVDKGINTPKTSSAGRLFDAVAALLGLCSVASFEAEGPMRLESRAAVYRRGGGRDGGVEAARELPEPYPYRLIEAPGELDASTLDFLPTVQAVVEARLAGTDPSLIAARFHSTMVDAIREAVLCAYGETGLRTAVCSGGLFQNRILLAETERRLREAGFAVYSQERVPTNDGGLALGQLAIAARRRMADVSGGSREGRLHTG